MRYRWFIWISYISFISGPKSCFWTCFDQKPVGVTGTGTSGCGCRWLSNKPGVTHDIPYEYMAMSDCSGQAMWIKTLLSELGLTLGAIPIYGDNQGSIFIGSNPVQEWQMKHIDIHYHYICQCIEDKNIELMFIEGSKNPADIFTKNLGNINSPSSEKFLGLSVTRHQGNQSDFMSYPLSKIWDTD